MLGVESITSSGLVVQRSGIKSSPWGNVLGSTIALAACTQQLLCNRGVQQNRLLTPRKCVVGRHDNGVSRDPSVANLDALSGRLSLQPGRHCRKESEALIDASLHVLEPAQGPRFTLVRVRAKVGKELVDLPLELLVHFGMGREMIEQACQCSRRRITPCHNDETRVADQVLFRLPGRLGILIIVIQDPVEDVW